MKAKQKVTKAAMLAGLLEVQKALAADRDGRPYVHPEHGAICLEELKYLVVDPLCGNDGEDA